MVEIIHGVPLQLSPRVRRITAANPGAMTGPGTNTYLLGEERIAVIDPGPADPAHIDAILDACGDRLEWLLVTHTHPDHSPAAKILAEKTGARLMGNVLPQNDGFQDGSFVPEHIFSHGELLACDEFSLRVLHTPGHVDNHLCFLVEEDGLLLTGDHIMQGSTVVIIPPHGNMKDYIASLKMLLDYPLKALAPGHGHIIESPAEEIRGLVEHRLGRERKVVDVLQAAGQASLDALTSGVYDDVDPGLHPIAQFSLLAHLLKLKEEGVALDEGDNWRFQKPL